MRILFYLYLLTTAITLLNATGFSKQATIEPVLVQKSAKQWCPVCGKSIQNHYKTSYSANLEMNGNPRQYCSLHCLAHDMKEYGLDQKSIKVIDVASQNYINAKDAYYVIKSDVYGTNAKVSKLAFKEKVDAQKFIKKHGGKLVSFNKALQETQNTYENDKKFFQNIKLKTHYFRGRGIASKLCNLEKIDLEDFLEIGDLKQAIVSDNVCRDLQENDLHDLALYLWEVKKFGTLESFSTKVVVREDEKCPVCGMFTYKYPRWAAQIFYEQGEEKTHYSFDGVKDLMKFYFNSAKWGNYPMAKKENIKQILVTDYYTQKGIDGLKAFYVIRSDIYGPMGHEFIPFKTKESAETFLKEHFGKTVLSFKEITEDQTYALDHSE